MMDDELKSADVKKTGDKNEENPGRRKSQTVVSKGPAEVDSNTGGAGSVTEIQKLSGQISSELSSADFCVQTLPLETTDGNPAGVREEKICNRGSASAVLFSVRKDPSAPSASPSVHTHTIHNGGQSSTPIRTQESSRTSAIHTEPDGVDLCASILLACLFCRPLDCLLATARGCGGCVWSLCSSLCGCTPGGLQPLLDLARGCHLCGSLALRRSPCDFSVCEICLHATECVDLGMEISQMLNH